MKIATPLAEIARKVETAISTKVDPETLSLPGVAKVDGTGAIQVYVETRGDPKDVLADLKAEGMETEFAVPEIRQVQGWVPASKLAAIAALDQVRLITLPGYAVKNSGAVNTQGDSLLKANLVRTLGSPGPYAGAGVNVCVISDGCTNRNVSVATGDLPAAGIAIHPSLQDPGDEGTAMAEIIYDLAPGVQLYAAGPATSLEMVVAIQWAVSQGCQVICDDLGFFDQPFFEDGPIATAARDAVLNSGVVYVTAAGNSASDHYQGLYSPVAGYAYHNFKAGGGEDRALDVYVPAGGRINVFLQWNDEFGQSGNDYDLYLWDPSSGTNLDTSMDAQNGTGNPKEEIHWTNTSGVGRTLGVFINKYSGSARTLELYVDGDAYVTDDDEVPANSIFGQQAVSEVISVGAIDQASSGLGTIETYSSRGPSTISYPSSQTRQTPTITAVDNVSVTGAGGFPSSFRGTSAAAPHIAAICALMLSKNPAASPTQIRIALTSAAVDKGTAGFDNSYGYGLADALAAVNLTSRAEIAVEQPAGTNLTDGSASIGFGSVNLGSKSSTFIFTVRNLGTDDLTGLAVTKDGTNAGLF